MDEPTTEKRKFDGIDVALTVIALFCLYCVIVA